MFQAYLEAIDSLVNSECLQVLATKDDGKTPAIKGVCGLDDARADEYRYTPEEAITAIQNDGAPGFVLYAGRPVDGTEKVVFTDHDDCEKWHPDSLPATVTVRSGSGRGYHKTFRNHGNVANALATGDLGGAGEVRANNWYVVLPGSLHPTGGIYHPVNDPGIATLEPGDLPLELRPGSQASATTATGDPVRISPDEIESLPSDFDSEAVTTQAGVPLSDIRRVSRKVDQLLTEFVPEDYPSASEADMAAVSLLLYWTFDEVDIANILRACRNRQKLHRDDYVHRTITRTAHTDTISPEPALVKALVDSIQPGDDRPQVSPRTLAETRDVLLYLDGEATIGDLVEQSAITWNHIKEDSVRRRLNRGLTVLEQAGYVSSERAGRTIRWRDEGLDDLTLPVDWESV